MRADELDPVASAVLGRVESAVGAVKERVEIAIDIVARRGADADSAGDEGPIEHCRRASERCANLLGGDAGRRQIGARQNRRELLSAEPPDDSAGLEPFRNDVGE